jgi:outer membrane biosynthesis protein TonB
VVVAVELSRLLRRGLLVAAIAAAGWLLSAVFAGSASADELPGDQQRPQEQSSGGLLGGLLGGLTHTVTGLTDTVVKVTGSVVDSTSTLLTPVTQPAQEPIVDVPELLPADEWTGTTETDRVDPAPAPAPAPVPAPQPVAPAPRPIVPAPVQAVAPAPVPPAAPAPQQAATQEKKTTTAADHHAGTGSTPEPVKSPAGPSGPGSTASAAHNDSGGARGAHGVLVSHTTLTHPADAGFTTRSRAVNAAGRDAGLPVSTPD